MNETVRRIGDLLLKSAGIVCALAWIVLLFWIAGQRIHTAITSNAPDVRPVGKVIEAIVYLVLTLPGFVALQRKLRARKY